MKINNNMNLEILKQELVFKAVRSSGAGGQHVNKVSSKVIVSWRISQSILFNESEKLLLQKALAKRINQLGELRLECEQTRSQIKNKELAIQKLYGLIQIALKVDKPRRATKVPKSVIRKRQENKQKLSEKKHLRKRVF